MSPWFQPLRITGMKVYTHEVDHREVILDLNIRLVQFSFQSCFYVAEMWPVYCVTLSKSPVHFTVMKVMWTSTLWWRSQSQLGSKDLKWATLFSVFSALPSSSSSLYVFTSGVKTVLNLAAQGDAEGHFGAAHWRSTTGGRRHLFFHSPPRECRFSLARCHWFICAISQVYLI